MSCESSKTCSWSKSKLLADAFHATLEDLFEFLEWDHFALLPHLLHAMLVDTGPAHPNVKLFGIEKAGPAPMLKAVSNVSNGVLPGIRQPRKPEDGTVQSTVKIRKRLVV